MGIAAKRLHHRRQAGITEEEYEAVVRRFAAIGIKVGTSVAMSSRPRRLRLPIDGGAEPTEEAR
jgi:hypothetical protein